MAYSLLTTTTGNQEGCDEINGRFDVTVGHTHDGTAMNGGTIVAGSITNVPAGNITATTVQAAINEIDGKFSVSGRLSPTYSSGLLVAERVVTEAITAFTFSGLTGVAHGGYVLVAEVINTSGSTTYYGLGVNGDTTPTNYSRQILLGQGSTVTAQLQTTFIANSIADLPTGNVCYSVTEIMANPDVGMFVAKTTQARSDGLIQIGSSVKVLTADITSLTITATVSNGICPSTKLTLYRRK